jgi:hypothetical protein
MVCLGHPTSIEPGLLTHFLENDCIAVRVFYAELEQQRSEWKQKPGEPYHLAALYARAGDKQNAFVWLEQAYQVHSQELTYWLRTDPAFDSIRSDPKYADLVRRIGFPQQRPS